MIQEIDKMLLETDSSKYRIAKSVEINWSKKVRDIIDIITYPKKILRKS
jgi:hypothetical protein